MPRGILNLPAGWRLVIVAVGLGLALPAVASGADESGPGSGAMAYLEALRAGDEDIEAVLKGTLLSPHCGRMKRETIRGRLMRRAERMEEGNHQFEVLAERRDNEYAAVLVAVTGQVNPCEVDVIPIGLREVGGAWKPAPLPGSFDNTNVPFDREVERRVAALEDWMSSEREARLEGLRETAMERVEKHLSEIRPDPLLKDGTPTEVVELFLQACEDQDWAKVLVFCREGLERDELRGMIRLVIRGMQRPAGTGGWSDLTSPDVVRVVAREEGDDKSALVSVICYDSENTGSPVVPTFDLIRVSGRWQIELPKVLRESRDGRGRWRRTRTTEELKKTFPECFEGAREARRFESLDEAGRQISAILTDGSLEELFPLLCRADDLTAGEKRVAYAEAAGLWNRFRQKDVLLPGGSLVGTMTEGSAGLVVLVLPMAGRLELESVMFLHGTDGWSLAPGVADRGNFEAMPAEDSAAQETILNRFDGRADEFKNMAEQAQLERFELLRPGDHPPVPREEAARLIRQFRAHLRKGQFPEAMAQCGVMARSHGAVEGLRALTYEYRGARGGDVPDQQLLVDVRGAWTGVSLRVDSGPSDEPDYPLYLVLPGRDGPRIAMDAGLRFPTNPGRGILNGSIWEHLEAHLDQKEVGLVRELYEGHRQCTSKDFEAWEKKNKSSR